MCITKKENVFVQSINITTESLNRIPGKTARWMWKIFTCMNLSHFPLFTCPNCISGSFVLYILRNQPIGWAKRIMNKTVFANLILQVENSVGWMTVNRSLGNNSLSEMLITVTLIWSLLTCSHRDWRLLILIEEIKRW